jgi:hypothetical protein
LKPLTDHVLDLPDQIGQVIGEDGARCAVFDPDPAIGGVHVVLAVGKGQVIDRAQRQRPGCADELTTANHTDVAATRRWRTDARAVEESVGVV